MNMTGNKTYVFIAILHIPNVAIGQYIKLCSRLSFACHLVTDVTIAITTYKSCDIVLLVLFDFTD